MKCIIDMKIPPPFNDEIQDQNHFLFRTQNQQINYLLLFIKNFIYELGKNEKLFDKTH